MPDFEVPTDADGNNVYLVQVTATDEAGGATTQGLSITVANDPAEEPPSPNEPPAFTIDAVVDENTTAVLTLAAVDPEGGVVDFALSGGEDQDLFTVEVPTDADGNNVYLVQVTATDEAGGATTQDLSITVANDPAEEPPSPNEPPAFTIEAVVDENTTAVLTLAAVDPEGGVVDFALSGGEDQDLFTVEVPTDADGNNVYLVQVTATDEAGGATTQDLSITVANDPAEEPPSPEEPIEVAALDFLL